MRTPTQEEKEKITEGAMDAMGIKKSKRAGVRRVVDYVYFLLENEVLPENVRVAAKNETSFREEKKVKTHGSPFLDTDKHEQHMNKSGFVKDRTDGVYVDHAPRTAGA